MRIKVFCDAEFDEVTHKPKGSATLSVKVTADGANTAVIDSTTIIDLTQAKGLMGIVQSLTKVAPKL